MRSFHGTSALITGASAGLGEEFALQLAPLARTLVLVARRTDRLEKLKADITAKYPECRVFVYGADLGDPQAPAAIATWLQSEKITIDLLINNAGLGDVGLFETADFSKMQSMLLVNVVALTSLSLALVPGMISRKKGAILNVSSSAGTLPLPTFAAYAATKAYVTSLSDALRAELRGTGVTVTALCPGPVETEFGEVASRPGPGRKFAAPTFAYVSREQVVAQALRGAAAGKARVVPGFLIWLFVFFGEFVPGFAWRAMFRLNSYRPQPSKF